MAFIYDFNSPNIGFGVLAWTRLHIGVPLLAFLVLDAHRLVEAQSAFAIGHLEGSAEASKRDFEARFVYGFRHA